MREIVYVLCFLTSLAVVFLLLRGYWRSHATILLWCGLGFVGLCLNNLLLIIDLMVMQDVDLAMMRRLAALVGMILLVYGVIWKSD